MVAIAQRPVRLSGRQYEPGDVVPDEVADEGLGSKTLVALGVLAVVPGGSEPDETPAFDPAEHSAAEVLAHLDQHADGLVNAGRAELERIVAAESDGRARKTLLAELEGRMGGGSEPGETPA